MLKITPGEFSKDDDPAKVLIIMIIRAEKGRMKTNRKYNLKF
jgi:hypothetical protein